MKRFGLLAACLLLVLANAYLFLRVALNRSGEPEATVALTGREVEICDWRSPERRGETGRPLSVKLLWNREAAVSSWLDPAKLEAVGFDCRVPADSPEASQHYGKMRPRQTFVVLEYEGPAYEAWRREIEEKNRALRDEERKRELSQAEKGRLNSYKPRSINASRLFPINVGNDPGELRRRYPDRGHYIITPAVVKIGVGSLRGLESENVAEKKIWGEISYLLVECITLSDQQCAWLEEMIPQLQVSTGSRRREWASPHLIRFTLCYGRNYEPWVADLRRLDEDKGR
jgi:hypothetical protein